jgi:hypothetical protein
VQYTGYVINRPQDIGINTKADMAKFCNADAIVRFIDIWVYKFNTCMGP